MEQRTMEQRAVNNQPVLPIGNAKNDNLQQIAFVSGEIFTQYCAK
jgi:hypothetical protein